MSAEAGFSAGRRFGARIRVLVGLVSLVLIVVMVNYISTRHPRRFDLSGGGRTALSPMTLRLLQSITNQVDVTVLYHNDPEDGVYASVVSLLNEYRNANPHIRVDRIDPARSPGAASLALARHRLTNPAGRDLVIFSRGDRARVVYGRELSDYDLMAALTAATSGRTNTPRRVAFKGEMLFSSALFAVMTDREDKVYFLQGHREHGVESEERFVGYAELSAMLSARSVVVDRLVLGATNGVPADCRLLVVAGPVDPLSVGEVDRVESYLARGGRLLVLFNSRALLLNRPGRNGLDGLMTRWGVSVGNNLVFDKETTANNYDLVASEFGDHPVVRPLGDARLYFSMPRSVGRLEGGARGADAPQVTELVYTGPKAVTVSGGWGSKPVVNPALDRVGRIPLAVAVERGSIQGLADDRGSSRMVVVGDSTMFANMAVQSLANMDFLGLTVNWLLDRSALLGGIEPRPVREYKLVLSDAELGRVRWWLLGGLPAMVVVPGLLVWLRRRR